MTRSSYGFRGNGTIVGTLIGATVAAIPFAGGCSSVPPDATIQIQCPPGDLATFGPVSSVLERRCGTIDCHGAPGRPLRIYGQLGTRRPQLPEDFDKENGVVTVNGKKLLDVDFANYYPGTTSVPTTDQEIEDNAAAACGLEPELTTKVYFGLLPPERLTLIRKPRLQEKHKGGRVWNQSDDGDLCLVNWVIRPDPESPASNATQPCINEITAHP